MRGLLNRSWMWGGSRFASAGGGGSLPTYIQLALLYLLDRNVENAEYPNKIGDEDRTALPGRALAFDGTQYAYVADNGALDVNQASTDFCISGWAKANNSGSDEGLFGKHIYSSVNGRYGFSKGTDNVIDFVLQPSGGSLSVPTSIDGDSDTDFHLFTARIDLSGSKVYVYVDGVLQNAGGTAFTGTFGTLINAYEFTLGAFNALGGGSVSNHATTQLRDIRIFHKDVTSTENLAKLQAGDYISDAVAWYMCEGTDTLEVHDASGNDYHLTAAGFDSTSFVEGNWQSLYNKFGYGINVIGEQRLSTDATYGFKANVLAQWLAYGTNTIEQDGNAIKTTYVDDSNGSYVFFGGYRPDTLELADFEIGTAVRFEVRIKVSSGASIDVRISDDGGGTTDTTVTNTEYETITINHTSGGDNMFIRPSAMGAGEIIWIEMLSAKILHDTAIPADMTTWDGSKPTHDIFGNVLTYSGQVKYKAVARDRSCFVGDGAAYWGTNSDIVIDYTKDTTISFKCKINALSTNFVILGNSGTNTLKRIMFTSNRLYVETDSDEDIARTNTSALDDTDWHEWAIRINNGSVSMTKDGSALTMDDSTVTANLTINRVAIGQSIYTLEGQIENIVITENSVSVVNWQFCSGNPATEYDVSGNGNHLTGVNTDDTNIGTIDYPEEDYLAEHGANFAGQFNGVDDYLSFAAIGALTGTYHFRLVKGGDGFMTLIGRTSGSANYMQFSTKVLQFETGSGGNIYSFAYQFENNIQYDITITADASFNFSLYVNGVFQETLTDATTNSLLYTYLGYKGSSPFGGNISQHDFWSRVLTPTEIATLAADGSVDSTSLEISHRLTGFESTETDLSGNGKTGTWNGAGNHMTIIPALSDKSADVHGKTLVYPQNGKNLIPQTYFSMPENVYELYEADQAERYEEKKTGDVVVDEEYLIIKRTIVDFTSVGAADNNVGTVFTASGTGITLSDDDILGLKTVQAGNNLVTNGGARNQAGALTAVDWAKTSGLYDILSFEDHSSVIDGATKVRPFSDVLNGSNLRNIDYDTFANGTPTGFDAIGDGTGNQQAATAYADMSFVSGDKYIIEFDLTLNSGTGPSYNLVNGDNGTDVSTEGAATASAGHNVVALTANASVTGIVRFINYGTATNYSVTNLSIRQTGIGDTTKLIDQIPQGAEEVTNGDFANWTGDNPDNWVVVGESGSDPMVTEVSGAARLYTTGSNLELYSGLGTEGKYYLVEIEVTAAVSGQLRAQLSNSNYQLISSAGVHQFVFRMPDSDTKFVLKRHSGLTDFTVDNVSVKELLVVDDDLVTNGSFTLGSDLNTSNCVNSGVNAYDTFANGTPTGFDVIHSTSGTQIAGTADEISITSGQKYVVEFDLALTSGTLPTYNLNYNSDTAGGVTSDGYQAASAGHNVFEFTANASTTGVLLFTNTANANYQISNLSVKDADTDWTKSDAAVIISGGTLNFSGAQSGIVYASQTPPLVAGEYYLVTWTTSGSTTGNTRTNVGGGVTSSWIGGNQTNSAVLQSDGIYFYIQGDANFDGSVDNVSVHKLTWGRQISDDSTNYAGFQYALPVDEYDFAIPVDYVAESIVAQKFHSGLAEDWDDVGASVNYSLVTGNGFSGIAQRAEVLAVGLSNYPSFFYAFPITIPSGVAVQVSAKVRSSAGIVFSLQGAEQPIYEADANTGDAVTLTGEATTAGTRASLIIYFDPGYQPPVGSWVEIDEVEVRMMLDGEFYEIESLGGDPIVVQSDYFLENTYRYLTRYNRTNGQDLLLIEADSGLDYSDHTKIIKALKLND